MTAHQHATKNSTRTKQIATHKKKHYRQSTEVMNARGKRYDIMDGPRKKGPLFSHGVTYEKVVVVGACKIKPQ